MKAKTIVKGISYFFIFLFLYTAISKLMAFNATLFYMKRNPLLGDFPFFWTIATPIVEIITASLLSVPATRRIGLWAVLVLMTAFTVHAGALLASDYKLPCTTCGRIFRELTSQQHLWINIGLVLLAVVGIILYGQGRNGKQIYKKDSIVQ